MVGSFKRAEAVRPELKRRASRQAAGARCRSSFAYFWIVIVALTFYSWRGSPRKFVFGWQTAAQGIGGALAER